VHPFDRSRSSTSLLVSRFGIPNKATPDDDALDVGARASVSAISGPLDGVSMIFSRLSWLAANSRFVIDVLINGTAD